VAAHGRDYGALRGRDKDEVVREYGEEQVLAWRRSYAVAPPRGESLRDVTARLLPYWYDSIVPDLRTGQCVLVVSHGNTLRALIKHLDGIGDDEIAGLEIPNGVPLCYQLDSHMRTVARGGRRLAG
jgi:2,3-bisphosphoglycerate-dependent phosphoglycerate mutase